MIISTCTFILKSPRLPRLVNSGILLLFVALLANGQGVGSSRGLSSGDGIHTIQGRVYFPNGQFASGITMKVSLESVSSFGAKSTATDQDGSFRFTGLQAGDYTVVVDGGKEYEVARETVNIFREASPGPRTIQVTVHLHPKIDESNPAFAGVPKSALDFYQKGTAAAQKGNAKSAAEFLSKAVAAYPNFSAALSDLGVQYMKLGQMVKAAETFDALLKLKPNDATAHLYLGIALYNQSVSLATEKKLDEAGQKLAQAASHLREALKLNSAGPSAHYYLGMTLIKLRRYDEAQSELESAIRNGGENLALAHKFLGGLYLSAHRNNEAAEELEKYLQLDPKAADADRIKGTIKDLRSKQ